MLGPSTDPAPHYSHLPLNNTPPPRTHGRHGAINEAYELVRDLDPTTPQQYVIKGVVHATLGQSTEAREREHLKLAQQCFQVRIEVCVLCVSSLYRGRLPRVLTILPSHCTRTPLALHSPSLQLVGTSAHECDTIPGRQCMASCFFLMRQFEDVNIYLNSVKVCVCAHVTYDETLLSSGLGFSFFLV